jgi:hypothetical protein
VVKYLQGIELPPSTKVKLLDFKVVDHDDPIGTEGLVQQLAENYVINVDSDEFWALPQNISDLPHLLREHPADIYFMRWVMVVDDELKFSKVPPFSGTIGYPGKYMVNRTMLPHKVYDRPFGAHTVPLAIEYENPVVYGDFTYGAPVDLSKTWSVFGRPLPSAGPFQPGHMVHIWGRSFLDVFLKVALRRQGDGPCQPLSDHLTEINERLATLAFLSLNEKEPVTVDVEERFFQPDTELEHRLALEEVCEKDDATAQASLDQFYQNYLGMKEKLAEIMRQGSYPIMWPSGPLTLHLAGMSVSDWLLALPLNITEV